MSALFRSAKTTDFDRLYRRHAASVYRYAYAVLGRRADAEDITQQTFLNAYRAIERGTRPRKAENWLLTIAHNELRRHFRTTLGRPLEVELDDEIAQPVPERSDPSVADIVRALQQLPPAQRSALVMREFEGRPYAEVAEIMGVSQSALEALLFRARRSLAEELEDGLTCAEAERALSLRLDGRLKLRERRRLRAHLRECPLCARFERVQKRQRSQLGGLSVMPIPASLVLVRGESAAAALGLGTTAAATGGSTAAVAGGAGATGIVSGLVAKAAAVTAAATVAGGVGYGVAAGPSEPVPKAERAVTHVPAVAARLRSPVRSTLVQASLAPRDRSTKVRANLSQSPRTKPKKPVPARVRPVPARLRSHAKKPKPVKAARTEAVPARAHRQSAPKVKVRPTRPTATKHAVAKAPKPRKVARTVRPARPKPPRAAAASTKPKQRSKEPPPAANAPPADDVAGQGKNAKPAGR
jgi:RNA polymerase sigma-70 factor, ECF subfamily